MIQEQHIPKVLVKFAQLLGTTLETNRLEIPEAFGSGYCVGYVFNEHIRMLISDYELKEDLMVKRPPELASGKLLFFKFQNIFPKGTGKQLTQTPSVLIATSRISTDDVFAIHSNTETINIEVDACYLDGLLPSAERSPVLHNLLQGTAPLFFEQIIYPALLNVVEEIVTPAVSDMFLLFFLRVKAEELICRLLMEIDQRPEKQIYPLNDRDIKVIYQIRDQLLINLQTPPLIAGLAIQAAMSPTKLKRLFRQIFGDSIFNYYQQFRMKEAARLLTTEKLSVAVVGYRLGFTNLSHFSRVFEAHMGMKPKQYSRT
ncbi:AraC-like DNA-binding protein [Mucilaginibacter gracilis]|uniref:AraC-like DNA-binding protein n=1 Tax=Mucilaginibacter gracilis TaxID=423350 RepID=A0A495J0B6_9SPHI|nr:AraC family transcriptional regulator [Mucilaginibacter gracilis]RKR82071.1 AraC-like DNA-binding protein [Mucilaginibacter gracilis]